MRTIVLPNEEELAVNIVIGDQTIQSDLFAIDEYVYNANTRSSESGKSWIKEFVQILDKKLGVKLTDGQALLLFNTVRAEIDKAKKKLLEDS